MRFVFVFLLVYGGVLFSQDIPIEQVKRVAQNFYAERLVAHGYEGDFHLSEPVPYPDKFNPLMYIFNRLDQHGFIIVSNKLSAYPVLAYSFESSYYPDLMPRVFFDILEDYLVYVSNVHTLRSEDVQLNRSEWTYYSSSDFNRSLRQVKGQTPLLQTTWNQDCYYNGWCPEDPEGPCGRVYAGCVATAMGQIMKYHSWPPTGEGSNVYHTNYGTLSVNFAQQSYDFSLMPAALTSDNDEVAKLLYHCGVSVRMDYSPTGSGASTYAAADAFRQNFRYASYLTHLEKDYHSIQEWEDLLRTEILSERPVFYRGYGSGGGHAFVCDGFQGVNQNHFHFNLGWGGVANGYYFLTNVAGFNQDQAGLFGVEPVYNGPQYCDAFTLLTDPSGVITDGSADNRYANNTSCKWLIQPENAGAIALTFTKLRTEPGVDRILVFEGTSENGILRADISGFDVPQHPIVVSGSSMFIWWFTDEQLAAPGWEAIYQTWFVSIDEKESHEVQIFPNPATNVLTITLSYDRPYWVRIYDERGGLMYFERSEGVKQQTIDISDFASGNYYVHISTDQSETIAVKKLVVIR